MMERDAVVGVTSNPTIFQKAIAEGNAYDEQLKELLGHEEDLKEIFLALSAEDIKDALALLRPAFDALERRRTAASRGRSIPRSRSTASARTRRRSGCTSGSTSRTST